MRDLLSWNLPLGRWAGVHVRLHAFFVLFAIFALHFSVQAGVAEGDNGRQLTVYALASIAILLLSVLAHEFGHVVAAWQLGGTADQIILWPFGGLTHTNISHDPRSERSTTLAGPLVNLGLCLLLAPPLIAGDASHFVPLLNPLSPPTPTGALTLWNVVQLAFWMNLTLVLVNLLPAFPLDGGRLLRAMLWPKYGFRYAVIRVAQTAKWTALVLSLVALAIFNSQYNYAAMPLLLLAVFLFFSARQDLERVRELDLEDGSFGYDLSQGYGTATKVVPEPSGGFLLAPMRQWLESRRLARVSRQREQEEDEDRRVDDVLARLHEQGLSALSSEDRALLDRVSARYRGRQRG